MTTWDLYKKVPLADLSRVLFLVLRNLRTYIPLITQIEPDNISVISRKVKGVQINAMPNYYYKTIEKHYFVGMYTAVLPITPGIYAIFRLIRKRYYVVYKSF